MEANKDVVSMSATNPDDGKQMTIAYSLKLMHRANILKTIQIIVLIAILITFILILTSGKVSLIGHNIFCR